MKVYEYLVLWRNTANGAEGKDFIQALDAQGAADVVKCDGIEVLSVARVCKNWK